MFAHYLTYCNQKQFDYDPVSQPVFNQIRKREHIRIKPYDKFDSEQMVQLATFERELLLLNVDTDTGK